MMIRKAEISDIETLIQLRINQLNDEEEHPDTQIEEPLRQYFTEHLNQDLIQYVMIKDGQVIATAGIQWMPFPPGFFNPSGIRGYICSVYTNPLHRGNRYSMLLLDKLVEEAREHHVTRLFLEASVWGKPVYEKFGFVQAGAMMEMKL